MRYLFLITAYLFASLFVQAQTEKPAYKTMAGKFENYYNKGSYDSIFSLFSPEMRAALPLDKTRQFLTSVKMQAGNITQRTFIKYEKTYASYKTNFEKALGTVNISVDSNSMMNGLFLKQYAGEDTTTKAPVNYNREELAYKGSATGLTYGATFTYPKTGDHFTVAILITGSGPQDRDGTLLNHKPFEVIADYLTNNGFAVLRVDDRGIGQTTGDFSTATSEDFAKDVEEHIRYVQSRKEINTSKIGLCGHSEGGMIAAMVAARNKEVAFVISLAGPAVPTVDLMVRQNQDVLRAAGLAPEIVAAYLPLYKDLLIKLPAAPDKRSAGLITTGLVKEWRLKTKPEWVQAVTGVTNDSTQAAFADAITQTLYAPWWRYFLAYNPQKDISRIQCPVLAINGSKDIQVNAKENLDGFRTALQKAGNKKITIVEMEGFNHLFQKCTTCTVEEYGAIKTVMENEVLEKIGSWIKSV